MDPSSSLPIPNMHAEFACSSHQLVEAKLRLFNEAPNAALHIVMDWDNTLTVRKADGIEGLTWAILRKHMTPENQTAHRQLYETYHPKEKTGTMTEDEAMAWQTSALKLLIGIPIVPVEHDATELVRLRSGVKQLFDLCQTYSVPTVIKSAGVKQVIDAVTRDTGLNPTLTHATKLLVTEGLVSGWDESTLIHAINKEHFNHVTNPANTLQPYVLLLGDDLQDARMVAGDANVLRIRVGGGRSAHSSPQEWHDFVTESYKVGYDMVSVSDSFESIVQLSHWILK